MLNIKKSNASIQISNQGGYITCLNQLAIKTQLKQTNL
jgi:hypothetical protein